MLENGWSREEAAQAYRADPVRIGIGREKRQVDLDLWRTTELFFGFFGF